MLIEVLVKLADTQTQAGAVVPNLIPMERVQRIGRDPATGRAQVYLLLPSGLGGGSGTVLLPTYEQYGAVAARAAVLSPANPCARVSATDEGAATNARAADQSAIAATASQV